MVPLIGDVTGSVYADNSTVLVDTAGKIILSNNTTDDLAEGVSTILYWCKV